jgi:hypothetical protein
MWNSAAVAEGAGAGVEVYISDKGKLVEHSIEIPELIEENDLGSIYSLVRRLRRRS